MALLYFKNNLVFYTTVIDLPSYYLTGCTLPKTSNVEWDCENGYVFPNVSVYTTCEPRCQDNNMILVTYISCTPLPGWDSNSQHQW
jgi:hypothetical protein